jgi:hypothetical protein
MEKNSLKNPIGAYASVLFLGDIDPVDGYYFSFGDAGIDYENDEGQDWGNDSHGVPDTHIFYYCNGGEYEMKSLMVDGAQDFKVLSYELVYEMENI